MAFNFFRKKEEGAPDIGKEETEEGIVGDPEDEIYEEPEKIERKAGRKNKEKQAKQKAGRKREGNINSEMQGQEENPSAGRSFEIERLNAKIEAVDGLIKGHSERFSGLSQQIGEIRGMTISNEKEISKISTSSSKAIDIVKEVEPEKLRIDYQKLDAKIQTLSEKLEGNKQFMETIMSEIKDLRRKAGIFIGTEALLKLNEEVKRDLIELQKLSARVNLNADKSEQIFIELKKGFADVQKMNEVANNLDSSYSGVKKEIEKLKLDYSNIVTHSDFNDFKKTFENKFEAFEETIGETEKIKEENENLAEMLEKTLAIAKRNKEDIADIAITIGDEHVKRVSDYENQLMAILKIIDTLAGNISEIRQVLGIGKRKKLSVAHYNKQILGKNSIKMQNIDVHPKISKNLMVKNSKIPKAIKKKYRNKI